MTTPPQRPGQPGGPGRPVPPRRPGQPGGPGRPLPPPPPRQPPGPRRPPPPDPVTRRIPRPEPQEPPTQQIRARYGPADAPATEQIRRPPPPPPPAVPPPLSGPPPQQAAVAARRPRNRMTIVLVAVIVLALVVGGLAGAELYARHRADSILVEVAQCVVEDGATISFGVNPPFLWQHITGHYTNISVETAGDNVQSAKGMTAEVTLEDVRLQETADAKGSIGSLHATLTWTSAGIKDTVIANLPVVGSLVTGVRTDPAAGTLVLEAGSNSVTTKPVVVDGDLDLQVVSVDGPLPQDSVQTALNELTKKLNDNYPLGIHADSVKVTDSGVVGEFSSQKASIPKADANPCFARL